ERELHWFSHTCKECRKCSRKQQRSRCFLIFGFRCMIHRERSARQAEHHNREEPGLITSCNPLFPFVRPEVSDIVDADSIEPEYRVECMMQAGRNEQSIEETIQTGAQCTKAADPFAKVDQTIIHYRPNQIQETRQSSHYKYRDDRYCTPATEESEIIRQLYITEFIVQCC